MVAADKVKPSPDLRLRFDTLQHRKRIPRGPQCFSLLPKTLVSFGDGLKVHLTTEIVAQLLPVSRENHVMLRMPSEIQARNRTLVIRLFPWRGGMQMICRETDPRSMASRQRRFVRGVA